MREQLPQRELADRVLGVRQPKVFDLSASRLDDPSIRDPGGTHRLAGATAEAQVDVAHLLLLEWHRPAFPLRHQIDAAARGFGLHARLAAGPARVETQSAVHARGEVVVAQEVEWFGLHTTNRPGFRMPSGSKAFLSRRITPIVSGGVPHAPICLETSADACISTSEPCNFSAAWRTLTTSSELSKDQCAMPTPGEAHHRACSGNASRISWSA